MKYKAVIFDLDGTLLDTLDDLADGVNYALTHHSLPARTVDEIKSFVGNGVANLISRSVPEGCDSALQSEVLATFRAYYTEHSRCKTKPYDGILNLLDVLREKGVKTAIVSNKFDAAVKELNTYYFADRIKTAIGETPDIKRKPAPDMIFKALDALSHPASDSVYIGDSEGDIKVSDAAGLDCICVTWGFRSREVLKASGGTTFADTPAELLSLLTD